MINQTIKTSILALVLLAQPPIACRDRSSEILTTGLIVGGAVALGCGIAAGVNYLCTPSNETLVKQAHDAEGEAQARYGSLISFLESKNYSLHHDADLSSLARSYVRGSVDSYVRDLQDSLNAVLRVRKNLNDRLYSLDRKGEQYSPDYRAMERWVNDLGQLESSLKKALYCVEKHAGYCTLYMCEAEMHNKYSMVVDIVDHYGNNRLYLAQYLREHVAVSGIDNRNPYPTISYIEKLNDRMRSLENAINGCRHNGDLLMSANILHSKLNQARSVLLADDRYAYEMQERERARREEERMRIERERVAAEQRKAEAAQRQAYAAERQNWEMARQNEILREQNRIERERNQRHRYCNHNRCCCDAMNECPIFTVVVH